MTPKKTLTRASGTHLASGTAVSGYEIHIGQTKGPDCARPWLKIADKPEGASSPDGRVIGAYVHGVFAEDPFRAAFLAELGGSGQVNAYGAGVEAALDDLADHLATHLDLEGVLDIARQA